MIKKKKERRKFIVSSATKHMILPQESIFYVFGSLGLVWCAAWWWVARDSPEEDRDGLGSPK